MIEPRDLAQEAQALARPAQGGVARRRPLQPVRRDLLQVVDQARDQAHRLAVAGMLAGLPGVAHARETRTDIGVASVDQARHRLGRCPGDDKVGKQIIVEDRLKDVRAFLDVLLLGAEMFVGVTQRHRRNRRREIARHVATPSRVHPYHAASIAAGNAISNSRLAGHTSSVPPGQTDAGYAGPHSGRPPARRPGPHSTSRGHPGRDQL